MLEERLKEWPSGLGELSRVNDTSRRLLEQAESYWSQSEKAPNAIERQRARARAAECYALALAVARAVGDRAGEGVAIVNLATIRFLRGEWNDAIRYCEDGIELFRAWDGMRCYEARMLFYMARAYQGKEEWTQAFIAFQQSIAILCELGQDRDVKEAKAKLNVAVKTLQTHLGMKDWSVPIRIFEEKRLPIVPIPEREALELEALEWERTPWWGQPHITTDLFYVDLDDEPYTMLSIGAAIASRGRGILHKMASLAWQVDRSEAISTAKLRNRIEVGDYVLVRRERDPIGDNEVLSGVMLVKRDDEVTIEDRSFGDKRSGELFIGEVIAVLKKQPKEHESPGNER